MPDVAWSPRSHTLHVRRTQSHTYVASCTGARGASGMQSCRLGLTSPNQVLTHAARAREKL